MTFTPPCGGILGIPSSGAAHRMLPASQPERDRLALLGGGSPVVATLPLITGAVGAVDPVATGPAPRPA